MYFNVIGSDVLIAGLATHFCKNDRLGELKKALVECSNASEVDSVLRKYCPTNSEATFSLEPHLAKINKYYSGDTIEKIFENLEKDNSEWARQQLKVFILYSK